MKTFNVFTRVFLASAALVFAACDSEADPDETAGSSTGAAGDTSTGEPEDMIDPALCQSVEAEVDCGNASESCVFDDDNHRVCDPIEGEEDAVQCVLDAIADGMAASLDSGYFVQAGDEMAVHYVIAADGSGWQESLEVSGGVCNTEVLYSWNATDLSDCSTIECLRIRFEAAEAEVCQDDFACE